MPNHPLAPWSCSAASPQRCGAVAPWFTKSMSSPSRRCLLRRRCPLAVVRAPSIFSGGGLGLERASSALPEVAATELICAAPLSVSVARRLVRCRHRGSAQRRARRSVGASRRTSSSAAALRVADRQSGDLPSQSAVQLGGRSWGRVRRATAAASREVMALRRDREAFTISLTGQLADAWLRRQGGPASPPERQTKLNQDLPSC